MPFSFAKTSIFVFLMITLMSGFFVVNITEQAVIMQFGELKTVHTEPGLKFKIPFIQSVIYYDKRVLAYDLPTINTYTSENDKIQVDAYVRYKIVDSIQFYRSITPATESGARNRLDFLVKSAVLDVLGKSTLSNLLSKERVKVMNKIQQLVAEQAKRFGLEIIDVRIIRTELQLGNRDSVLERMKSELIRFAKQNRAKGEEVALGVRARADTERATILAKAEEESRSIKGKADAEAIGLTNAAFGKDPELYELTKNLDAFEKVITNDSHLVLSTNSAFFNLLKTQPKH